MNKNEMRKYMKQIQSEKSTNQIASESEILCEKLESYLLEYLQKNSDNKNTYKQKFYLATFYPRFDEPDIRPVLQKWEDWGNYIVLPVISKDDLGSLEMNFHVVNPFEEQIHSAPMRLMEPNENTKIVNKEQLDLIFVPGMCFDKEGRRLGRGKGYYDRFLSTLSPTTPRIAPIFSWQLVDCVPTNELDQKVHIVISPFT